jgi:metallopeptidase YgjP-like protein
MRWKIATRVSEATLFSVIERTTNLYQKRSSLLKNPFVHFCEPCSEAERSIYRWFGPILVVFGFVFCPLTASTTTGPSRSRSSPHVVVALGSLPPGAPVRARPLHCIEYVLVHEMVHLLERRHSDRFRVLMDQVMPQWRLYRDELNQTVLAYEDWM